MFLSLEHKVKSQYFFWILAVFGFFHFWTMLRNRVFFQKLTCKELPTLGLADYFAGNASKLISDMLITTLKNFSPIFLAYLTLETSENMSRVACLHQSPAC